MKTHKTENEYIGKTRKSKKIIKKTKRQTRSKKQCGGTSTPKIYTASLNGLIDVVKNLLDSGADVDATNDHGDTALISALQNEHVDIVEMLLDYGADVNVKNNDGYTALYYAGTEFLEILLDIGVDWNKNSNYIFFLVSELIQEDSVDDIDTSGLLRMILDYGANVDTLDKNGDTVLFCASEIGFANTVKILLDYGADVNVKNNYGDTALIIAVTYNQPEIVTILLMNGADVNANNNDGYTALNVANNNGNVEIVTMLLKQEAEMVFMRESLKKEADMNAKNADGNTALMLASRDGRAEIVTKLLEMRADVNVKNNDDETALKFARDNVHKEIIQKLILVRDKVSLKKNVNNQFDGLKPIEYDPILMEDVNFCEYVNEKQDKNKDNLLFFFSDVASKIQFAFFKKSILKTLIADDIDSDKIIYQCKNTDIAFQPRDENIIGGPALNMDIMGLFGVMVPLSYLDEVVNGEHQIFVIEPTNANKTMPIASLNTRLGGDVTSANHCQVEIPNKVGTMSYVEKDVLIEKYGCVVEIDDKKRGKRKSKRRSKKTKSKSR
jgi:ankyrin repeat protein